MIDQRRTSALLSVDDTRLVLGGIGRTKLYDLVKKGALRPIKLGRRTLFSGSEVADFIADLGKSRSQSESA